MFYPVNSSEQDILFIHKLSSLLQEKEYLRHKKDIRTISSILDDIIVQFAYALNPSFVQKKPQLP